MRMYPNERKEHSARPLGFSEVIRRSKDIPDGCYLYVCYNVNDNRLGSCFCRNDESALCPRGWSDFRITSPLTPSRLWKFINATRRDDFGLPPI